MEAQLSLVLGIIVFILIGSGFLYNECSVRVILQKFGNFIQVFPKQAHTACSA